MTIHIGEVVAVEEAQGFSMKLGEVKKGCQNIIKVVILDNLSGEAGDERNTVDLKAERLSLVVKKIGIDTFASDGGDTQPT